MASVYKAIKNFFSFQEDLDPTDPYAKMPPVSFFLFTVFEADLINPFSLIGKGAILFDFILPFAFLILSYLHLCLINRNKYKVLLGLHCLYRLQVMAIPFSLVIFIFFSHKNVINMLYELFFVLIMSIIAFHAKFEYKKRKK
ncbi:hypothetical protein NIE88_09680 [Sporolactobacillus shoreicorticis]|uniref:Uncharacterized protein n=1 Tax=Sporolactobacillus shoreicorticis TaxID=1923877 RepID=A0ABW5S802_9BACL|nr:hypothetical protein [Sporolactobacillus shoreicorticis]MCO7126045.1 hypothetical protein [Sporolactobacillus shoreicorticis]